MATRKIEVELIGDSRSLERAFSRSSKASKGFARDVGASSKHVARNIGLIGAAVGAVAVAASKSFSSFEESLSKTVGLAGVNRKAIEGIKEAILDLGPEVAKGPQELADAFFFIASSGLKGQKALDALTVSAKASAAGLGDTLTVADAVTSAMNAYAKTGLGAGKATDILVAAVREGKVEADGFSGVIGNLVPTAAALGISFDKIAGALAVLSRTGTDAEEGATQLSAVMSSLLSTSPKVVKALRSVGLSQKQLRNIAAGPQGLIGVFRKVDQAFEGNVEAMRQVFPNVRAFRAVMNALAQSGVDVDKILKGVTESTGDAANAFKQVSEDEAFKFRQTLASLQVVGIRLGAILAPVAKKIADGATAALGTVADFLEELGEAKTVKAKIDVIFEGVKEATKQAQSFLGDVIAKVDWAEVWGEARGIADGFQEQLEQVDFGFVGQKIGEGIATAVRVAIPAAKELGDRITEAMKAIDFEEIGKSAGPGLAAAIVTGFTTLLDPGFWFRNWDLTLAVAATVFRARIATFAAKLFAPLARLGGQFIAAITPAIVKGMSAIPGIIARSLVAAIRTSAALLGRLASFISKKFNALGKVARFTIRVLGLNVAINAVANFAKRVAGLIGRAARAMFNGFREAFNNIKKRALKAAIEIVEPFTHIPGFLGGGTFRDLQAGWKQTLKNMEKSTDSSVRTIQTSIDSIKGKTVTVTVQTGGAAGDARPPEARAGGKKKTAGQTAADRAKQEADADADAARDAANARRRAAAIAAAEAKKAKTALEKAKAAFEALMGGLDLKEQRAARTRSVRDDLAVLREEEKAVRDQIKVEGRTLDLQQQLFEIEVKRADLRKQQREQQLESRKQDQFKALGLTATGEKPVASVGALTKRLSSLKKQIKGTILDTPKTQAQLARIAKVLSGKFGKVGKDVRAAILAMFAEISGALGEETGGNLTKRRITAANFGMPSQSAFGFNIPSGGAAAAGGGKELHIHLNMDGREVSNVVIKDAQLRNRRQVGTRRGRHGGTKLF